MYYIPTHIKPVDNNDNIFYAINQKMDTNDVYYGLLMYDFQSNVSKNLIVDKNIDRIVPEMTKYWGCCVDILVFYRIVGFNPYYMTLDILKSLPENCCQLRYLIRYGEHRYFFTFTIHANTLNELKIRAQQLWHKRYDDNDLGHMLYNKIDQLRSHIIHKSLNIHLKTKNRQELLTLAETLSRKFKWYNTKKHIRHSIIRHVLALMND